MEELKNGKIKQFDPKDIICDKEKNLLGSGSFARVIAGEHRTLGKVAVKCRSLQGSTNKIAADEAEIKTEIQLMNLARHEHVIRVEGLVRGPGWVGIVMEYMAGGSLYDLVFNENVRTIPPILILRMSMEMTDALAHMHTAFERMRIAHGDLKPQNILLTADLHCKVADFGGAALGANTMMVKTNQPNVLGQGNQYTPFFTAPERFNQHYSGRLTTKMDVYSIGVILYVILTRKYPIQTQDPVLMVVMLTKGISFDMKKIYQKKMFFEAKGRILEAQILNLLQVIMQLCTKKNPKERPSMDQINNLLQNQAKDVDIIAAKKIVADMIPKLQMKSINVTKSNCSPLTHVMDKVKEDHSTIEEYSQSIGRQAYNELNSGISYLSSENTELPGFKNGTSDCNANNIIQQTPTPQLDKGRDVERSPMMEKILQSQTTAGVSPLADKHAKQQALPQQNKPRFQKVFPQKKPVNGAYQPRANGNPLPRQYRVPGDGINIDELMQKKKKGPNAVEVLQSAKDMCKKIATPKNQLKFFQHLATSTTNYIENMEGDDLTQQVINFQILPEMNGLMNMITALKDVDAKLVAKTKAECLFCIALCYFRLSNIKLSSKFYMTALSQLVHEFKDDCMQFQLYGAICTNMGFNCKKVNEVKGAEQYYVDALFTYNKAKDFKTEESRNRSMRVPVNHLAVLYKENSSLLQNARMIFKYLQDRPGIEGFTWFQKHLMTLSFALPLNLMQDTDALCREMVIMTESIPNPPERCDILLTDIKHLARIFLEENKHTSGLLMLQCALNIINRFTPEDNEKVNLLHNILSVISLKYVSSVAKESKHILTEKLFPLQEEIIQKIKDIKRCNEQIRLRYLSSCVQHLSYCYMEVEDYSKSTNLAEECLQLLSKATEMKPEKRKVLQGTCNYMLGEGYFELQIYTKAELAYQKAIELLKGRSDMKNYIQKSYKRLGIIDTLSVDK